MSSPPSGNPVSAPEMDPPPPLKNPGSAHAATYHISLDLSLGLILVKVIIFGSQNFRGKGLLVLSEPALKFGIIWGLL